MSDTEANMLRGGNKPLSQKVWMLFSQPPLLLFLRYESPHMQVLSELFLRSLEPYGFRGHVGFQNCRFGGGGGVGWGWEGSCQM